MKLKKILAVVGDRSRFTELSSLLAGLLPGINLCVSAKNGLFFATQLRFDLLILVEPLPDLPLGEVLRAVHQAGSPCADSPILVVTDRERVDELAGRLAGGLVEVVAVDDLEHELPQLAPRLLGVATRGARRILVELTVRVAQGKIVSLCQTENLSESGLLLRSGRLFPVGTGISLELALPGEARPIRAEAAVVRHTDPRSEGIEGMGVQFLHLAPNDRRRLRELIRREVDRPSEPEPVRRPAALDPRELERARRRGS